MCCYCCYFLCNFFPNRQLQFVITQVRVIDNYNIHVIIIFYSYSYTAQLKHKTEPQSWLSMLFGRVSQTNAHLCCLVVILMFFFISLRGEWFILDKLLCRFCVYYYCYKYYFVNISFIYAFFCCRSTRLSLVIHVPLFWEA